MPRVSHSIDVDIIPGISLGIHQRLVHADMILQLCRKCGLIKILFVKLTDHAVIHNLYDVLRNRYNCSSSCRYGKVK